MFSWLLVGDPLDRGLALALHQVGVGLALGLPELGLGAESLDVQNLLFVLEKLVINAAGRLAVTRVDCQHAY